MADHQHGLRVLSTREITLTVVGVEVEHLVVLEDQERPIVSAIHGSNNALTSWTCTPLAGCKNTLAHFGSGVLPCKTVVYHELTLEWTNWIYVRILLGHWKYNRDMTKSMILFPRRVCTRINSRIAETSLLFLYLCRCRIPPHRHRCSSLISRATQAEAPLSLSVCRHQAMSLTIRCLLGQTPDKAKDRTPPDSGPLQCHEHSQNVQWHWGTRRTPLKMVCERLTRLTIVASSYCSSKASLRFLHVDTVPPRPTDSWHCPAMMNTPLESIWETTSVPSFAHYEKLGH